MIFKYTALLVLIIIKLNLIIFMIIFILIKSNVFCKQRNYFLNQLFHIADKIYNISHFIIQLYFQNACNDSYKSYINLNAYNYHFNILLTFKIFI